MTDQPDLGFTSLLRWFTSGFNDETPEPLRNSRGVWVGPTGKDIPPELTGGSILGSPRLDDGVRRLTENSPYERADADTLDEAYLRPMRAALATLARKSPFMAKYLAAVAYSGGDWQGVATERGFVHLDGYVPEGRESHDPMLCDACYDLRRAVTEQALRRLHRVYLPKPRARIIRTGKQTGISESQAQAVYGDVA